MSGVWLWLRVGLGGIAGVALLMSTLSCAGILVAPEWGAAGWLVLLLLVLMLPLQRFVTGTNRIAVSDTRSFRQLFSLRLPLAWVPSALSFAAVGLLVISMARPMEVQRDKVRKSDGLDILLAIDTSCSMEATDLAASGRGVTRLEVAKGVVGDFVQNRPEDRIGVVVFGEEAFTHVPLTLDHNSLADVLTQVEIGVAGARGTAIGNAIAVSAKRMRQVDNPERIVILLTDGQNNAGRFSPIEAADAAGKLGIRIYTIGVGGAPRGLRRMFGSSNDGLDERTLKAIADKTGGAYFRATTAESLSRVYAKIDELETSPAEVEEEVDERDYYRYALAPGLGFLGLFLLLGATIFRRWP
ncbi:MAG: Ca-activated chloride channel family protein [Kiritimatiellia bacterium]|jgi:Ca-activated chloride channel family protein